MENNLIKFIINSRKKTYASNTPLKINREKSYSIKKGSLEYQDIYYDQNRIFQGQEVIFQNNSPIWSFSYRGIVQENINSQEVFSFLKKILKNHADKVRFYMPFKAQLEVWRYDCKAKGSLEDFSGKEIIYYKQELIYQMQYFGGMIK